MAFLDKTGLQTVTNKLVQGDAIKVASIRGRTIENVIDNITRECTNVPTPLEYKIENRVADFRVGQGRDVDASGDVEKGYSEIEFKGKTYQNLSSNIINYRDTNKFTYSSSDNWITAVAKTGFSNGWAGITVDGSLLKANTKYTVIWSITSFSFSKGSIICHLGTNLYSKNFEKYGVNIFTITTTTTLGNPLFYINAHGVEGDSVTFNVPIVLEGDYTQTPVEELPKFFEGIQSSFEDGVVAVRSGEQEYTASIGEPLRSLPNGVCDEIRNNNGKWELVRRVNRVDLKGTEYWIPHTSVNSANPNSNYIAFLLTINTLNVPLFKYYSFTTGNYYLCDKMATSSREDGVYGNLTGEAQMLSANNSSAERSCYVGISVLKNKLTTEDANGFKKWLQANPITVYYELAEPIITPIEPIKFETQPLGSITINSEISPTSFHTVQLNRAGQIERGITEIAELKNRVEILETMYDSHFLETAHKLELLGMDYELESEEF